MQNLLQAEMWLHGPFKLHWTFVDSLFKGCEHICASVYRNDSSPFSLFELRGPIIFSLACFSVWNQDHCVDRIKLHFELESLSVMKTHNREHNSIKKTVSYLPLTILKKIFSGLASEVISVYLNQWLWHWMPRNVLVILNKVRFMAPVQLVLLVIHTRDILTF